MDRVGRTQATVLRAVRGLRHEQGAGLAEYALLLLFIAAVAILALAALGETISGMYDDVVAVF